MTIEINWLSSPEIKPWRPTGNGESGSVVQTQDTRLKRSFSCVLGLLERNLAMATLVNTKNCSLLKEARVHVQISIFGHTEIYKYGANCGFTAWNSFQLKVNSTSAFLPLALLPQLLWITAEKLDMGLENVVERTSCSVPAFCPEGTEIMSEITDFADKNKLGAKTYQ